MASVSGMSSMRGPQIVMEADRLVIKRAVVNTKNVAYDIFITFQSGGKDIPPPTDYTQINGLAHDISILAERILKSLPPEIDRDNLEKLGFLVKNTADESNPDTAILVSNTASSVMDSWKRGVRSEYTERKNLTDISLNYDGGWPEEVSRPLSVHDGLIELRSYLNADRFIAMRHSAKKKEKEKEEEKEPSPPVSPKLPNTAISFEPTSVPHPNASKVATLGLGVLVGKEADEDRRNYPD